MIHSSNVHADKKMPSQHEEAGRQAGRRVTYVTNQHSSVMYSTSKRKYKYDTNARNFAVTINGFMALTSYFDEKYRY